MGASCILQSTDPCLASDSIDKIKEMEKYRGAK